MSVNLFLSWVLSFIVIITFYQSNHLVNIDRSFPSTTSLRYISTMSNAQEMEAIRNIFNAVAGGITGGDVKSLPKQNLLDLCIVLKDPITPVELDRAKNKLADVNGNISFDQFITWWTSEDEL